MKRRGFRIMMAVMTAVVTATFAVNDVKADIVCDREITANIVAIDQPVLFNRLGASNVNGMIFALRRDVVEEGTLLPENQGGVLAPGLVQLRPDKRPRPLVLRVRRGDCLTINLQNLLDPIENNNPLDPPQFNVDINEQVADRAVSFHVAGMQLMDPDDGGPLAGIDSDGSLVGANPAPGGIAVNPGDNVVYRLYAEQEGVFNARGMAAVVGSDANEGNSSNLLLGAVIVEPTGAQSYRSLLTEEEMRLAADTNGNGALMEADGELTPQGHPIIDYEAVYPAVENDNVTATVWVAEGKAGLPILNMMDCPAPDSESCEIVHSELEAVNAYAGDNNAMIPAPDGPYVGKLGHFPMATYPLESVGLRNPTVPNRLEPFRDFASIWHDEPAAAQAFPGFYVTDPVFRYILAGVKDGFMINYGSGGIGSEIIANRLGVGPMHDCLTCAFEEFFLTSFTVGDPAQLTDVAANFGLETLLPSDETLPPLTTGPKANYVPYPGDPANIHHSYTSDFVKIRNTHIGKEQHVFHLHNHQWLFNANDDNSNYLDAQGIGPGIGYTYEINFGGSGNRNKTAGDSIFHCHFYPHFAQGMWYHWRHHDVFESGTILEVSASPTSFHTVPFALENGTPMLAVTAGLDNVVPGARVRALPDGEVAVGAPIPAIVPLPDKPMAPVPGEVQIIPNPLMTAAGMGNNAGAGTLVPVGSLARVVERDKNPGYPFWIGGIEDVVGQRPPTPPLDMVCDNVANPNCPAEGSVAAAQAADPVLFADLIAGQADGWDGGLPRAALQGYAAGGHSLSVVHPLDFTKEVEEAQAVFYPEYGTDVERIAMAYHAELFHNTFLPDGTAANGMNGFRTNGSKPAIGAPYMEPCIDDEGVRLGNNVVGDFFSATGLGTHGSSFFNADTPRIYKGVQIQYDAVLNKLGYHYPQQRIITLWEDAVPVIGKQKPGEPLVMRFNTFDCAVYHHANLTPEVYEIDDYQVRTPTDIIGQHIHLPKWGLPTADGAANGWNYEDGTLAAGAVRERINALNTFVTDGGAHITGFGSGGFAVPAAFQDNTAAAADHPFFAGQATLLGGEFDNLWKGARTTTQRWFFDPVVNTLGTDRGLGIIFTHDHYGPSTHQQIGLYATVLTQPANSRWVHNETGEQLGQGPDGSNPSLRSDGGPTSWQAAILPQAQRAGTNVDAGPCDPTKNSDIDGVNCQDPFREFYFEYSDFQHAYEAGVYIGADQYGVPTGTTTANVPELTPNLAVGVVNEGNPDFSNDPADAFRFAINPPARTQVTPVFPDLVLEVADAVLPGCPTRPCPQAIDVQDPGMFVVNYRNEPIGARIYDPRKVGADNTLGTQAGGFNFDNVFVNPDAGDLALAFQSRNDRAIAALNFQPMLGDAINGTSFPAPINFSNDVGGGDPFTPMPRVNVGDLVRIKQQSGGDEEEHNSTIHGMKWLQGGSGFGRSPNSGWRNAQAGGISEQFTLRVPIITAVNSQGVNADYLYSMDASPDGHWSGIWGIIRSYNQPRQDLYPLPNGLQVPVQIRNANRFNGICPTTTDGTRNGPPTPVRSYDLTAVLANDVLDNNVNVTIQDICAGGLNPDCGGAGFEGVAPDNNSRTLVYNPRTDSVGSFQGPLHDPTAVLWVRTADLVDPEDPKLGLNPGTPVEPLILRAAAGECIEVTLRNKLLEPAVLADNNAVQIIDAAGFPVFFDQGQDLFADRNGNGIAELLACPDGNPPGDDGVGGLICADGVTVPVTELENAVNVAFDYMPNLPTLGSLIGAVKRDRFGIEGSTTFQTNLMQTSALVGLHPQLVAYDVSRDDGAVVGNNNRSQLIAPGDPPKIVRWYAGDISPQRVKQGNQVRLNLVATPVELGGSNLQPADKIRQGMKSLIGQLVIEPPGATWNEDTDDPTGRQTATVCPNGAVNCTLAEAGSFRDFSAVWAKGLSYYYSDSDPVAHVNGEAIGIPEDPQEGSHMAINFGIEPLWFRAGILPESPFSVYGAINPQYDLYSNSFLAPPADPATPVFLATKDKPFRMRVSMPHGTNRGSTFQLHGHVWQRDPYVCPGEARDGLTGLCLMSTVGSRAIGHNPVGFFIGGQESIWPANHYDVVIPSAGGGDGETGDYLFRDVASFGNASGLWGIVRVEE